MADLTETPAFPEGIYQIEQTDPVLGGPPNLGAGLGITNVPLQQLANRTRFLKNAVAPAALLTALKTVDGSGAGLDADLLDGKHASEFLEVAAFGAATQSLSSNGYKKFPGGLILQWGGAGSDAGAGGVQERLFPIPFPTSCLRVIASDGAVSDTGSVAHIVSVREFTASGFRYLVTNLNGNLATSVIHWIAIGT
ncbi:MAG: hypothetical protein QM699_07735 [Amaricoccus sp.]|uniref:gp53-like domain-containing protein n=1 Tax=Amaricoccus sp. TaxID=1872485 RepID=UPI0039E21BDF